MPALSLMVLEAAGMAQDQGLAVDADGEWPIQDRWLTTAGDLVVCERGHTIDMHVGVGRASP
jgi:hypothetical protein